jgi:hypothetical protein
LHCLLAARHCEETDGSGVALVAQVNVHTSKRQGAGTAGAVFVTLHGSQGPPVTSSSNSSSSSSSTGTPRLQQQSQQTPTHTNSAGGSAAGAAAAAGWRSSGRHELRGGRAGGLEEGSVAIFSLPSMRSLGQLRQLTLELQSMTVS